MAAGDLPIANLRFGLKLFRETAADPRRRDQNKLISPVSIALALHMTYNGADGETRAQMAKVLELEGISLEELNSANAALIAMLDDPASPVQLDIANSLWLNPKLEFVPAFLQRTQEFYHAEQQKLTTAEAINDWVSQHTNGKIEKILDEISEDIALYLINAIYFKGEWQTSFDKALTHKRPFNLLDSSVKQVEMMEQPGWASLSR